MNLRAGCAHMDELAEFLATKPGRTPDGRFGKVPGREQTAAP